GNIAGDSFNTSSLVQVFNSSHALGTNGSTLNVARPLSNGSFASHGDSERVGTAKTAGGSSIPDYNVTTVTPQGPITPTPLTVKANTDSKICDGTTSSTVLATVTGNIGGDTFTNASLTQVFNSSHALGANGSTLNVAQAFSNGSFATN